MYVFLKNDFRIILNQKKSLGEITLCTYQELTSLFTDN